MATVSIEGLDAVLREVRRFEDTAVTKQANKAGADVVYREADRQAPVESGRLRSTGRTSGTKAAGFVRYGRASVPYAGPIHFGHNPREQGGFTEPNPWLYDAADDRDREVREAYDEFVEKQRRRTF